MNYRYGRFLPSGKFEITNPDTPYPWVNYLTNGDYCALTSQHGGGFSFYKDPVQHGILRREMGGTLRDCPGRFFYIQDPERNLAWSPNRVPMDVGLDNYKCIHEPGLTKIESSYEGIEVVITYFVPPENQHEIWKISVNNSTSAPRKIRVISLSEWLMGKTKNDSLDRHWDVLTKSIDYDGAGTLVGKKRKWSPKSPSTGTTQEWPYLQYKTTTLKPESWETDRRSFFGRYRGYHNPRALDLEKLERHEVEGKDAIGSFEWRLNLSPKTTETWSCVLGLTPRKAGNEEPWKDFQADSYVEDALSRTREYWKGRTGETRVDIPDEDVQRVFNTWVPCQVSVNNWFGRAPSFWHSSQGYKGFRDACQDTLGILPIDTDQARKNIKHLASFTYESGLNSHRTPRGEWGADRSDNADDPLWVPLALDAYLKETGDWEFLEEKVGYLDSDRDSSVLEHMIEGIDYVLSRRGPNNLPLIRGGDWNDALDNIGENGQGESVFTGQLLVVALEAAAEICDRTDEPTTASRYREEASKTREVIKDKGWDGEWFSRILTGNDNPIGSKENEEGSIYLNTQTWAVLANIADKSLLNDIFDTLYEKLKTRRGFKYFEPSYEEVNPEIGTISQFVPGKKENGSIFNHANAFAIIALAKLDRHEDAYQLLKTISPCRQSDLNPDLYGLEPYAFCQNVTGPSSPDYGEGNYHWLSGTVSWTYRALLDYVFGIQPEYEGVTIDPCLPPEWGEVSVTREIRGNSWWFKFRQGENSDGNIDSITVDGEPIEGNFIPHHETKGSVEVEIEIK